MAGSSFTVIGIGAATLDALSIVPEFRADEHVTQAQAYAEDGGGPVATALCVLAAAGHPCVLIDRCGHDVTGQKIRAGLEEFGVSTNHLRTMPGARSASASLSFRRPISPARNWPMRGGVRPARSSARAPTRRDKDRTLARSSVRVHE